MTFYGGLPVFRGGLKEDKSATQEGRCEDEEGDHGATRFCNKRQATSSPDRPQYFAGLTWQCQDESGRERDRERCTQTIQCDNERMHGNPPRNTVNRNCGSNLGRSRRAEKNVAGIGPQCVPLDG